MTRDALDALARRAPAIWAWLRAREEGASQANGQPAVRRVAGHALEVDGIRLESAHDARGEARLQARLVPADARRATLYGLAQGTLLRELLARPALEALRVVLLSPRAALASLERDEHPWIEDERVELVRGDRPLELEPPFAAAPAALRLAHPDCARLADLVRLELATPYIRAHARASEPLWRRHVAENEALFASDPDVACLFGTRPGARVRVAAAGPSLAEHFERLRGDDTPLVAVDAALLPLVARGIVPDVVVSVDAHEDGMRRVFALPADLPRAALARCTLVWTPVVPRAVVEAWPGPRAAALLQTPFFDSLARRTGRARLWSSGSVTHVAVDLARRMGAAEIELLGADFAHVGGRTHAAGAAWEGAAGAHGPSVENGHGERVPTLPNLLGYLRDLERYIAAHPELRFVNASRSGARIAGAPVTDPDRVQEATRG